MSALESLQEALQKSDVRAGGLLVPSTLAEMADESARSADRLRLENEILIGRIVDLVRECSRMEDEKTLLESSNHALSIGVEKVCRALGIEAGENWAEDAMIAIQGLQNLVRSR